MGHVKYPTFHFFEKLPQVIVVKGQGTLGKDGDRRSFRQAEP